MNFSAVIVAAGSGSRMKLGYNKVFYRMKDGKTVLEKTVQCFAAHPQCREIILVTQKENFALCKWDSPVPIKLCEGGAERSSSVMRGLEQVSQDIVLVHDGARPYLSAKNIDDLLEGMKTHPACILAVPCKDTIKVVDENGMIVDTPKRSLLYQAQTPQAFQTQLLKEAYQKAKQDKGLTDDASCVEKYTAVSVKVILGDYANIKITTAEDLKE